MFDDRRPQLHLSVLLLNRARTLSRFSSRLPINPTLMDDSLQRPEKSRKLMSSADILALLLAGLFAVCTRGRFYRPKAIPTGAFGHIIFSRLGNTVEAEKRQASDEDAPQPLAAGRATVT
jgi:hypothetical protein